jgi:Fur family peroxide stress response transcriptional regulator
MEDTVRVLKERDIRPTQQRLEVYQTLLKDGKHLTADEIHGQVKARMPAVSLATVYTILDLFKQKNVINEIRIQYDKSCYEARIDPHHHFFCRQCKSISDLSVIPCKALEDCTIDGNVIEELQGYFYGVCRNCLAKDSLS